jgi:hypothetical protein
VGSEAGCVTALPSVTFGPVTEKPWETVGNRSGFALRYRVTGERGQGGNGPRSSRYPGKPRVRAERGGNAGGADAPDPFPR